MNNINFHFFRIKRQPKRIPRLPVMRLPSRFWQDYGAAIISQIVDEWKKATQRIIIDRLPAIEREVANERPGPMRADAWPDEVSKQLVTLSDEYAVISKQSADIAAGTFQAVNGVSHRQWYDIAKKVMGIDVFSYEPWIESEAKAFIGINTDLITKIQSDVQSDVSRVVMEGFRAGKRHETIANELLSGTDLGPGPFDKASTRADLVARDQSMKLYGNLAQHRQEGAGIKFYIFRTMEDERTRGNPSGKYPNAKLSHYCMDGKICRWDDPTVYADSIEEAIAEKWKQRKTMPNGPGIELHPGQDIQCRCYASPVFETLFQ